MANKTSLVSVIIPTYNRSEFLEKAIQSVINQTYQNIELIIVDDGSDENYAEIMCESFDNCICLKKNNGGLSSARNFGVLNSKGEYIAFLDDDDFWRSDKIEKQVNLLMEHQDIDLIHSSALVVNEEGKSSGMIIGAASNKIHKRSGNVFWNALGVWVVKSPTPLIRRNVFKTDLMFDEEIKVGEDIDFYQRMFFRHKIIYINEPLAFYRVYQDNDRLSTKKKMYVEIGIKMYENFKKMGIHNPMILHRIAIRMVKQSQKYWNSINENKTIKINSFDLYLRPVYCLNNLFN